MAQGITPLETPCVEWTGTRNRRGYGNAWSEGRFVNAHRLAWIERYGPIPKGLWVLHLCDNPPCINPIHLFLGTRSDNAADMVAKGRSTATGLCQCGRPFDQIAGGQRRCSTCKNAYQRRWYAEHGRRRRSDCRT